MGQIIGSTQNVLISLDGGSTFKTLVCLRTSSVNTTANTTTEATNCGSITSPGVASMSLDFDAVCETAPTTGQITYDTLLDKCVNGQSIVVNFEDQGQTYKHEFEGYISDLTINQATEEFINFSGTVVSTGALSITF